MSVDEQDIIVTHSIGNKVVKVKYFWNGEYHTPEIGTDCCGNRLEYDYLVNSVPTTSTFHHLCHEGMVFDHSDRHTGIADAANLDILMCIPAGNPDRQVHMRYYFDSVTAGTLDIDMVLYKNTTVSDAGSLETVPNVSDYSNAKISGVTISHDATVTDIGERKVTGAMLGEKRSTSSSETHVPEWILTPNGDSLRYYLFRLTNNSGAAADIIDSIFFFDSEAN